jgi:hypothetical protein
MRPNDAIYSIIFVILVLLLSFAILTQNQPSLQQQSSQFSPIPSLAYAADSNRSIYTTLNLFDAEMRYLDDNGFKVVTMIILLDSIIIYQYLTNH